MLLSDYVEERLIELGATPEYKGYRYLLYAIMLAMEDETVLNRVTTGLYPAIAQRFGVSAANVERSLRTVVAAIWCDGERATLKAILGRGYREQPGNAKFIGIISKRLQISYRSANRNEFKI